MTHFWSSPVLLWSRRNSQTCASSWPGRANKEKVDMPLFATFRVTRFTSQTRKTFGRLVSRPTVTRVSYDLPECEELKNVKNRKQKQRHRKKIKKKFQRKQKKEKKSVFSKKNREKQKTTLHPQKNYKNIERKFKKYQNEKSKKESTNKKKNRKINGSKNVFFLQDVLQEIVQQSRPKRDQILSTREKKEKQLKP